MTYRTRCEFLGALALASIPGILPASTRSKKSADSSAARLGKRDFGGVRDKILKEVAAGSATGVAVAVVHKGQIIWEEGFGWANREAAVKATSRTPFNLASLTKPFTTTTLVTLVAEGKLSLDDPANNHLVKSKIVGANLNAGAATVRHQRGTILNRCGTIRFHGKRDPGLHNSDARVRRVVRQRSRPRMVRDV
jgi:CubicO group peptidase (beta-lactamase class C family)